MLIDLSTAAFDITGRLRNDIKGRRHCMLIRRRAATASIMRR